MKFKTPSFYTIVYLLQLFLFFFANLKWMQAKASGTESDQVALLKFRKGITSDPHGTLNSWNDSRPFCNWTGITCGPRHERVTSLILEAQNLVGSISPYIGNLSFLRLINLQNNTFRGEIPEQVGKLFRLREFLVRNNSIQGKIPLNVSRCSQLKMLDLGKNRLAGKISEVLCSLPKLEMLGVQGNDLTGEIPKCLGNLSSLAIFKASYNHLEGSIPHDIGRLTRLYAFTFGDNRISGIIPPSFFNISSLQHVAAPSNRLNGSLPDNLGMRFPNLQHFAFGGNKFSGPIPKSLPNASQLILFDIADNKFWGQVPKDLGNLQFLTCLGIQGNHLGSNSSNGLAFLTSMANCSNLQVLTLGQNGFGGILPNSIANLSTQLRMLDLSGNEIIGSIPLSLENFINLNVLVMEDNHFIGTIPYQFGKLKRLQGLYLAGNRLSGQIPSSIGNITQLSSLYLSGNRLEGSIPSSIVNCRNLYELDVSNSGLGGELPKEVLGLASLSKLLDLSQNSFTGKLPADVGNLKSVNTLDISNNNLSGEIPRTIGDCLSLEYLYLQRNSFQGTIPSSLAFLKGLQYLDISRNNLSGKIPKDLQEIPFLRHLNLSFNDLEGDVPMRGVFMNARALSLVGNEKLCGGVAELRLPKCPTTMKRKGKRWISVVIIACAVPSVLLILVLLLIHWKTKLRNKPLFSLLILSCLPNISYKDLHRATNGFSSSNLIGSGSFGSVYKGFLNQGERPVAVKVLKLEQTGASKSFMAECKALRSIRHRNLVKLITCCISIDFKGNAFKALIFEFMGNGSLEKWLHPSEVGENEERGLNLLQRINIVIDVASALHYLHDLCERPIIHCDLKPSNILLDDDMVAHVSDFGLARLFTINNDLSSSQSSTIGIKGTIGYVAPEYGMSGAASKEGDVYSYGILVLEMFSKRKPTDEMFKDGLNLHGCVKTALPEGFLQIVDPVLVSEVEQAKAANVRQCLLSILEIGVACSMDSPMERMNMDSIVRKLHLIKDTFLKNHIRGQTNRRLMIGS